MKWFEPALHLTCVGNRTMNLFFLILLIGGFVMAAATALIRGLMAFFQDAEYLRQNGQMPSERFGMKQNRMMTQRVIFQGIAVLLIALIGALASKN